MGRASIVSVFPRVIAHDAFYATDAWLYHYAKRILANVQGGHN